MWLGQMISSRAQHEAWVSLRRYSLGRIMTLQSQVGRKRPGLLGGLEVWDCVGEWALLADEA